MSFNDEELVRSPSSPPSAPRSDVIDDFERYLQEDKKKGAVTDITINVSYKYLLPTTVELCVMKVVSLQGKGRAASSSAGAARGL